MLAPSVWTYQRRHDFAQSLLDGQGCERKSVELTISCPPSPHPYSPDKKLEMKTHVIPHYTGGNQSLKKQRPPPPSLPQSPSWNFLGALPGFGGTLLMGLGEGQRGDEGLGWMGANRWIALLTGAHCLSGTEKTEEKERH